MWYIFNLVEPSNIDQEKGDSAQSTDSKDVDDEADIEPEVTCDLESERKDGSKAGKEEEIQPKISDYFNKTTSEKDIFESVAQKKPGTGGVPCVETRSSEDFTPGGATASEEGGSDLETRRYRTQSSSEQIDVSFEVKIKLNE